MASKAVFVVFVCVMASTVTGLTIEIPESCKGKTYCDERPENFPEKLFDEHIQEESASLTGLFSRSKRYENEPRVVINDEDDYNCHSKVSIIQPYVVQSNTTVKLVVQSNFFKQLVKQTECLTNGSPCFQNVLKPTLSSSCTPTDGTIKLYLYNMELDRFEHEPVTFPVCCSCSIKSNI